MKHIPVGKPRVFEYEEAVKGTKRRHWGQEPLKCRGGPTEARGHGKESPSSSSFFRFMVCVVKDAVSSITHLFKCNRAGTVSSAFYLVAPNCGASDRSL